MVRLLVNYRFSAVMNCRTRGVLARIEVTGNAAGGKDKFGDFRGGLDPHRPEMVARKATLGLNGRHERNAAASPVPGVRGG